MFKFKKDRMLLLKELRDLVDEGIKNASINPLLDLDVSEMVIELTDKKRLKRLKVIDKELEKWIDEMKREKKEIKEGADDEKHINVFDPA